MLISCEQWRKEFGVDDLVKCVYPARLTSTQLTSTVQKL